MGIVRRPLPGFKKKIKCPKLTTLEAEISIFNYFDYSKNLMVPNVSWGFDIHECDILMITPSNYAYEIEIKVSRADLKKDLEKCHGHRSDKIKGLHFAIPEYLEKDIDLIPERAGIIIIRYAPGAWVGDWHCSQLRPAITQEVKCLNTDDLYKIARLGTLRIPSLKRKIQKLKNASA